MHAPLQVVDQPVQLFHLTPQIAQLPGIGGAGAAQTLFHRPKPLIDGPAVAPELTPTVHKGELTLTHVLADDGRWCYTQRACGGLS
jgi:hypothetical protein